ncbi:MAG: alpha-ketoacid dehydrogenase subunit beta [Nitrospirae bacterium YQR-1]
MPWTKVHLDNKELQHIPGLRTITYADAVKEALRWMLSEDPSFFIMGEGVDDPGGVFGTTTGLAQEFGCERVMDIPIAENAMTGVAIGAAIAGMKPLFVHIRTDFLPMCMDQIINHAAKWYYMTGGSVNVPLVIRSLIGRGWGSAGQHSQALHGLFTQIPGLKVLMPATPYDVKGLLISAVKDGNPVMFFEHRWIYDSLGYVPEHPYEVPIGQGIVRRKGTDITVVAISHMVYDAMRACGMLSAENIEVELIDPRCLKPLDEELICESVKKTGRLVVADVSCPYGGAGAEIAAMVADKAFKYLKAPIKRVNFPDVPTPASGLLEEAYYPDAADIIKTIKELL